MNGNGSDGTPAVGFQEVTEAELVARPGRPTKSLPATVTALRREEGGVLRWPSALRLGFLVLAPLQTQARGVQPQ